MGKQWAMGPKLAEASRRGAALSKISKEITVAAKLGDPNPANNPRLRAAVETARKASMSRDTIERAIKKGAGLLDETVNYETITYEGFAPHQVGVIVECLTDNRNRTASDIRVLFRKGQIGAAGSVAWMFDRMGVIQATHPDASKDIEEAAIEAGAQSVEAADGGGGHFICDAKDLDSVNKALTEMGWNISLSELSYIPKNPTELGANELKEVMDFLKAVDDHDDVHRVYAALP